MKDIKRDMKPNGSVDIRLGREPVPVIQSEIDAGVCRQAAINAVEATSAHGEAFVGVLVAVVRRDGPHGLAVNFQALAEETIDDTAFVKMVSERLAQKVRGWREASEKWLEECREDNRSRGDGWYACEAPND